MHESVCGSKAAVLAVNTLALYKLTALIRRPDRLVYLSSGLHRGGECESARGSDADRRRGHSFGTCKIKTLAHEMD